MLHSRKNRTLIQLLSNTLKHPIAIGNTFDITFLKNLYFSFYLVLVTGRQFVPRFWIIFLVPAIDRNARYENTLRESHYLQNK